MSETTLFPDSLYFMDGHTEAQAMRIAQKFRGIGLTVFDDAQLSASRKAILHRGGIRNLMQLVSLSAPTALSWPGAGPAFQPILLRLQQEVMAMPEKYIEKWETKVKPIVYPDALEEDTAVPADFFGMMLTAEAWAAEDEEGCEAGEDAQSPYALMNRIARFEACIVAAIRDLQTRWKHAGILRRYFIEGASLTKIARSEGFSSAAAVGQVVEKQFLRPLLRGETLCGIRFSESLLRDVEALQEELCYSVASPLEVLERMVPARFLSVFGLTLMQRRQMDAAWDADYIVRRGEVQQCRRTLHGLFSVLQDVAHAPCSEKQLSHLIAQWAMLPDGTFPYGLPVPHDAFLHRLLQQHNWIERQHRAYRLVAVQLSQTMVRLARIIYDAHRPLTISEISQLYEQRYLERPRSLPMSSLHRRFPEICPVRRGVWEYRARPRR